MHIRSLKTGEGRYHDSVWQSVVKQTILCHTETNPAWVSVLNTLLSALLTLKEPDTLGIREELIHCSTLSNAREQT